MPRRAEPPVCVNPPHGCSCWPRAAAKLRKTRAAAGYLAVLIRAGAAGDGNETRRGKVAAQDGAPQRSPAKRPRARADGSIEPMRRSRQKRGRVRRPCGLRPRWSGSPRSLSNRARASSTSRPRSTSIRSPNSSTAAASSASSRVGRLRQALRRQRRAGLFGSRRLQAGQRPPRTCRRRRGAQGGRRGARSARCGPPTLSRDWAATSSSCCCGT